MKVSIIISCYNQAIYLNDSIGSVLKQSFKDWECIIIDDGSTDDTKKVAELYTEMDKRIRYIYQENKGVCVARNNAISQSTGKYVLCLDADDKISPEYVALSVAELDNDEKVSLVVCNYQYFGRSHRKVFLEPYSIEKLMGHNLFVNCSMFRRCDFDKVNGFNLNMKLGLEDWDLWLSILEQGGNVSYLEGIHFFYRIKKKQESRNLSTANDNLNLLRKQIWENHQQLYSKIYSPPYYAVEYTLVAYSKEYYIGKLLLTPLRKILSCLRF